MKTDNLKVKIPINGETYIFSREIGNVVSSSGNQIPDSTSDIKGQESVYFFHSSIMKGKIVAGSSDSGKIQVSCFNLNNTVTYSVDENCIFPSDKFNKYHLIKKMAELSVGMKVFVFNGLEFTQGVVKRIGIYNADVNYEEKTNKGKTKRITRSFSKQILIPNLTE